MCCFRARRLGQTPVAAMYGVIGDYERLQLYIVSVYLLQCTHVYARYTNK